MSVKPRIEILGAYDTAAAALARALLAHERDCLPDLTDVTVLVASGTEAARFREALLATATWHGFDALLLPAVLPPPQWGTTATGPPHSTRERVFALTETVAPLLEQELPFLDSLQRLAVAEELLTLFDQRPSAPSWPRFRTQVADGYGVPSPARTMGPWTDEARLVYRAWRLWQKRLRRQPEYAHTPQIPPEDGRRYYLEAPADPPAAFTSWLERQLAAERAYVVVPALSRCLRPLAAYCAAHPDQVVQPRASAWGHFVRGALGAAPAAALPETAPDRIDWCVLGTLEDEALFVAAQLQQTDGARRGIVCPNRKLARRLRAVLERRGIPLIDSAGWRLATTSASTVVALVWEAALSPRHSRSWELLARCPYMPARDATAADSAPPWDESVWLATAALRACREGQHPLAAFHAGLMAALTESGIAERLLEDSAGAVLLDVLAILETDLRHYRGSCNAREYWSWLTAEFDRARFVPGRPAGGVHLLDLAQAMAHPLDRIWLVGADAHHLGDSDSGGVFFNDAVRQELGFPTSAAARHERQELFAWLLEGAPRLTISWHRFDQGRALRPSPWFERVRSAYRRQWGADLPPAGVPEATMLEDANSGSQAIAVRVPPSLRPTALSAAAY
ncbi:MAG TPA: hypothetical protein VFN52_01775, partial [Acidiferrobacteraceae bacterium]|nr:hypothetical protein [Acidiferrobacteraceae bacterium]